MIGRLSQRIVGRVGSGSPLVRLVRPIYAKLLEFAASGSGLRWDVNGSEFRIHPSLRHLIPHENEPELFHFLKANISPGQTVLDIGSFLGTYAVFEALWTSPGGRVVAFEPTPDSCRWIETHARFNGVADHLQVVQAVVGESSGQTRFRVDPIEPYRNTVAEAELNPAASDIQVPVVTVDEFCARSNLRPDWIRMDVQGFEFHVLRGARQTIAECGGRLKIVAEMHPYLWPKLGFDQTVAYSTMEELGLRATTLKPGSGIFEPDGHVLLECPP